MTKLLPRLEISLHRPGSEQFGQNWRNLSGSLQAILSSPGTYSSCLRIIIEFISAGATFSKISFKSAQYTIQDKVSPQRNSEPGEAKTRRKREVASDEDYYSFPIRETLQEDTSPYSGQVSDLGSALLSSALDVHKVRRTKVNTCKMYWCSDSSSR